ncbi:6-phosphogluconolactonase [Posidoniimonas corsicana]|uniref:6-phosphogluconolactonase n=1 Tax=Posidoniimonas corsicana TaxID=1938618 RepID=A0A5C5USK8_9BACT|nr:lactonase family protein [Posidoniimonas corsicana]TWT29364.1 6-phosphogluconolactonase [Posidoniimonas corsicana]
MPISHLSRAAQALLLFSCYAVAPGTGRAATPAGETQLSAYLGTYNSELSRGVYRLDVTVDGDSLQGEVKLIAEADNPSFLALAPGGRRLYAVGEVREFQGRPTGKVVALQLGPAGEWSELNAAPTAGGGPCYVSLDNRSKFLLIANYGAGTVASLPVQPNGKVGPAVSFHQHTGRSVIESRQSGPHAHCIVTDPSNRFALAADLGTDKVYVYRFDEQTGELAPHDPPSFSMPAGAGPRHLAFHPKGRLLLVINELSSTLASLAWDPATGALEQLDLQSTLPADYDGRNSCADVHVHPSGRFVYGSNRGHDSIAVFAIDPATGTLTPNGHTPARVRTPRNFGIVPSGEYLLACGQDSDSVSVFRVNQQTGELTPIGEPIKAPRPVCVRFITE